MQQQRETCIRTTCIHTNTTQHTHTRTCRVLQHRRFGVGALQSERAGRIMPPHPFEWNSLLNHPPIRQPRHHAHHPCCWWQVMRCGEVAQPVGKVKMKRQHRRQVMSCHPCCCCSCRPSFWPQALGGDHAAVPSQKGGPGTLGWSHMLSHFHY